MITEQKIKELLDSFSQLLSSEITLEEINTTCLQIIEELRNLFRQDKDSFPGELLELILEYKSVIDTLEIILLAKTELDHLRSKEEIEDYLAEINTLLVKKVLSDINVKRIETIRRALLEKYKDVPSEKIVREEKDLERSFGLPPNCPGCSKKMVLRGTGFNYFWGCIDFPKCWGIVRAKNTKQKANTTLETYEFNKNFDRNLFEKLKTLRIKIAKNEKLPAYIIAWDTTLFDMAIKKPQKRSDLNQVDRVGDHFINNYGDQFIEEINKHLND